MSSVRKHRSGSIIKKVPNEEEMRTLGRERTGAGSLAKKISSFAAKILHRLGRPEIVTTSKKELSDTLTAPDDGKPSEVITN